MRWEWLKLRQACNQYQVVGCAGQASAKMKLNFRLTDEAR